MDLSEPEMNCKTLLKRILHIEYSSNNKKLQKKRFQLLTRLISYLFKSKNSKRKFQNINSLIILFLNFQKKSYPIDMFTESFNRHAESFDNKVKDILKNECLPKKC